MMPISLKLKAFGPFKNEEVIEFNQLKKNNLFLITGKTGSGKTSILDGICYALYGETSGTYRPEKSIRCQNASNDITTEVSFTFSLKSKEYTIYRRPSQERLKKKGDGFTQISAEASLEIKDSSYIKTGFKNVTEEIINILGLELNQFRQIIILPQGEFRELLFSKSDKRGEMLKKIFQTNLYSIIEEKFKLRSRELVLNIKKLKSKTYNEMSKISLLYNILDDENLKIELKNDLNNLELEIKNALGEEEESLNIEDLIDLLNKYLEKIDCIQNDFLKEIECLDKEYKSLSDDNNEVIYINNKRDSLNSFTEKFNEEKTEFNIILNDFESLNIRYKNVNKKEYNESIEKLKSKKLLFIEYDEKLEKAEQLEKELEKIEFEKYTQEIKSLEDNISEMEIKLLNNDNIIEKISNLETDLLKKDRSFEDTKTYIKNLNSFKLDLEDLKNVYQDTLEVGENYNISKKSLDESKKKLNQKKKDYHLTQAMELAKELNEGEPCPVCGSKDHPKKNIDHETEISLEELNLEEDEYFRLEKALEKIKSKYVNRETTYFNKLKEIKTRAYELIETNVLDNYFDLNNFNWFLDKNIKDLNKSDQLEIKSSVISIKGKLDEKIEVYKENELIIKDDINNLKRESKNLKYEKKLLENIKEELKREKEKLEKIKNDYEDIKELFKEKKYKLKGLLESVPMDLKDRGLLKKDIESMSSKISKLEKDKEDIVNSYNNLKNKKDRKEELVKYTNSKIEEIEKIIDHHPLKDIDIKSLANKMKMVNERLKKINEYNSLLEDRKKTIKKVINNVEKIVKDIRDYEEKYKITGNIYDIMSGKNNKNISFERYVLRNYLNEVISIANQRFNKMTNGRFILELKDGVDDKRVSAGLDLEVFDNYTGGNRTVRTLSGGESFKASLSMALALGDVVRSHYGGVNLDTLFIDEGFGTLDQNSLDSAINCLIELQKNGRLIGVISHVEELKNRISTQLVIENVKDESKIYFKNI